MSRAVDSNDPRIVQLALDTKPHRNQVTANLFTAVMASDVALEVIELLVKANADLKAEHPLLGKTALMMLAERKDGALPTACLLAAFENS